MPRRSPRRVALAAALLAALACTSGGSDPTPAVQAWPVPTVAGSFQVPCPHGIAVGRSAQRQFVYATSICGAHLTRLDHRADTLAGAAPVGLGPAHVAVDPTGETLYTTDQIGGSVTVVRASDGARLASIQLPVGLEAYNVLVSANGARVYVTTNANRLYAIDAASRRIVDSAVVGGRSNGLAFHPVQPILYVASIDQGIVVALDLATLDETRRYSLGGSPQRIAVSPDGRTLYASNEVSGFNIVNLESGTVSNVALGNLAIGMAIEPDGGLAYVARANTGQLRVVDLATRQVLRTMTVGIDLRNVAVIGDGLVAVADQAGGRLHVVRP